MSPSRLLQGSRRGERGFTLFETLVALLAGLIVTSATFAILDISLKQSTRIADRVSADQRARIAMEKIMLELHSSCVAPKVTPVEPESTDTKLRIVSNTGLQPSFATVTLHVISLDKTGKLIDTSYLSTGAAPAPDWEFSKAEASTRTLLTGVSESKDTKNEPIPVFQYYRYEGAELSTTPMETPLSEAHAIETAAITVGFTTAPESSGGKTSGDQPVDLTDTAVLRFDPALASGTNSPCA